MDPVLQLPGCMPTQLTPGSKSIVGQVFGQIKGARGLGRFLLRGLEKVNGEWALMATTHNISKPHRAALAAS